MDKQQKVEEEINTGTDNRGSQAALFALQSDATDARYTELCYALFETRTKTLLCWLTQHNTSVQTSTTVKNSHHCRGGAPSRLARVLTKAQPPHHHNLPLLCGRALGADPRGNVQPAVG